VTGWSLLYSYIIYATLERNKWNRLNVESHMLVCVVRMLHIRFFFTGGEVWHIGIKNSIGTSLIQFLVSQYI
jgi:predicted metallopeptidase